MDAGQLNFSWSQALVAGFQAAGVRHAVISPGARSTPLALAMLRQPGLRCHVAVDERSAAFFALGLGKASRRPALLLATSGSAPGNWLPAIIEASQSATPMLAITADRPAELLDCGANQTIPQHDLFGRQVRGTFAPGAPFPGFDAGWLHRLAAQATEQANWPHPGPVHLNQPFREPLLPQPLPTSDSAALPALPAIDIAPPQQAADPPAIARLAKEISGRPGLIVCGQLPPDADFPDAVTALAAHLDCPILAEPLSGLRFGPHQHDHLCVRHDHWLSDAEATANLHPAWALRFGSWPVSRALQNYLRPIPLQALADPWPRWSDPAHGLTHLLRSDPTATCQALLAAAPSPGPAAWRRAFIEHEARQPAAGDAWHISALVDLLPDECALFIGNSLAIRQFAIHAGSARKRIHCHGNRGASGIDGNIATALGLAEIHGRVIALIGDLTCQHDLGSLALANGKNAVIVTVNNGGGGIFDHLPPAGLPEYERAWRTPQQIHFEQAAACFGLTHWQADDAPALHRAIRKALAAGGPHLVEIIGV